MLEVVQKYPECFFKQAWYKNEAFASEKGEEGEYDFDFESKHLNKSYEEQIVLLGKDTKLLSVAVLAEAICIHFKETGERLLHNWYSRTSSLDSDGNRVRVGVFGADGLYVNGRWDDDRDSGLGVSSARKLATRNLLTKLPALDPFELITEIEDRLEKLKKLV